MLIGILRDRGWRERDSSPRAEPKPAPIRLNESRSAFEVRLVRQTAHSSSIEAEAAPAPTLPLYAPG
jgi:hypothetical protein